MGILAKNVFQNLSKTLLFLVLSYIIGILEQLHKSNMTKSIKLIHDSPVLLIDTP